MKYTIDTEKEVIYLTEELTYSEIAELYETFQGLDENWVFTFREQEEEESFTTLNWMYEFKGME